MTRQIILPDKEYNFHNFFNLRVNAESVLDYFGYTKRDELLQLPQVKGLSLDLGEFKLRLKDSFYNVEFDHERTRREFLIAPVVLEVARFANAKVRSEFWLEFNHQLKGYLSYLLNKNNNYLLIEGTNPHIKSRRFGRTKVIVTARESNLKGALNQLFVQLIALDKYQTVQKQYLYGVVSTGHSWQFVILDRQSKQFLQDLKTYDLSSESESLISILVGILENEN
jgi:hypothetical protein